jgi:hypothetical protein
MKEVIKITRSEMIEHLIGSMMEAMLQDDTYVWSVCKDGWVGYRNMTVAELIAEYRQYISEDPNDDIEIQLKGESE